MTASGQVRLLFVLSNGDRVYGIDGVGVTVQPTRWPSGQRAGWALASDGHNTAARGADSRPSTLLSADVTAWLRRNDLISATFATRAEAVRTVLAVHAADPAPADLRAPEWELPLRDFGTSVFETVDGQVRLIRVDIAGRLTWQASLRKPATKDDWEYLGHRQTLRDAARFAAYVRSRRTVPAAA